MERKTRNFVGLVINGVHSKLSNLEKYLRAQENILFCKYVIVDTFLNLPKSRHFKPKCKTKEKNVCSKLASVDLVVHGIAKMKQTKNWKICVQSVESTLYVWRIVAKFVKCYVSDNQFKSERVPSVRRFSASTHAYITSSSHIDPK